MMIPTAACLVWAWMQAASVAGPAYPPDAMAGGTVVAVLHVASGAVDKISIQQGDAPFDEPAKAALARWRFEPRETGDALVVIDFRSPALLSASSGSRNLNGKSALPGLAYPRKVTDPVYPPNALAEGSVVLRIELSETGTVSDVKPLQSLGGLTSACTAAVRSWQFAPAQNHKGSVSKAPVYAVCVFRRPVLPPQPVE